MKKIIYITLKSFIIAFIKIYQYFSYFLPKRCRFDISCSNYGIHVIQYHGVIKGIWMLVKRLLRCHPYN